MNLRISLSALVDAQPILLTCEDMDVAFGLVPTIPAPDRRCEPDKALRPLLERSLRPLEQTAGTGVVPDGMLEQRFGHGRHVPYLVRGP
jgi:hypothetical protein